MDRRAMLTSSVLATTASALTPRSATAATDDVDSNTTSTTKDDKKRAFLRALDRTDAFNTATPARTALLNDLTTDNPTTRPGSVAGFRSIAPGTWRIVYAPHISTLSALAGGGSFDPVLYDLRAAASDDAAPTIVSHARYDFPLLGKGWLSVSGTYGSQDGDRTCKVEFDRAWVSVRNADRVDSFEEAPETPYKNVVNRLGRLGFQKNFAVFPVSYLDEDTIVFDFDLFGTRICARKVDRSSSS